MASICIFAVLPKAGLNLPETEKIPTIENWEIYEIWRAFLTFNLE